MAGLLGDSWEDPKTMAALMGAAGLLGGGNIGQALGRGVGGYAQMMQQAQEQAMAKQKMEMAQRLQAAQIADYEAQALQRKQAAGKQDSLQSMLNGILQSQGASSQYGVGGNGISLGGVSEPMQSRPGGLAGATPEQIAALKVGGADVEKIWELAKFGKQMQPGYRQNADNTTSYFGDPSKGLTVDQRGRVSLMPNAAESQAALAGATKDAEEQAKARYDLVQGIGPQGAPGFVGTRLEAANRFGGQPQPAPQAQNPAILDALIRQDMAKNGDQSAVFNIGGKRGEIRVQDGGEPFLKTGLSPSETASNAANSAYMQDRAKTNAKVADTLQEDAIKAPGRIANYQRLGDLLAKHDGGAFSQTGVDIAKGANSAGFKIDPLLGNKEAANALSGEIALSLRNPSGGAGMPGALSEKDLAFLRSMVPGITTSSNGRQQMIQSVVAVEKRKQKVADFARKYENKYGKLDNDFFSQLQEWSDEHSIFAGVK